MGDKDYHISVHESMTENLNKISGDLLQAKWFFLASIAALGTAYVKFTEKAMIDAGLQYIGVFITCLIGNIIFWFLSEYTLSHAFLFRYVQSKLADVEKKCGGSANVKDPSDASYFINSDNRLYIDYFIPDQFVPIYWASVWLIIINTCLGLYLIGHTAIAKYSFKQLILNKTAQEWLLWFSLISLPLIWKLWTYYAYKLDKFTRETAKLEFKTSFKKSEAFFRLPTISSFVGLLLAIIVSVVIVFAFDFESKLFPILLVSTIGYFWPVPVELLIHTIRTILRIDFPANIQKIISPLVTTDKDVRIVNVKNRLHQVVCLLYNIV
jgi:hypothetical protein